MNHVVRGFALLAISAAPLFAQEAPPPAVVVAPAAMSDISPSVLFNGRLEADRHVSIIARVSGTLWETNFEAGDMVEEGHVLFRIEDTLYKAAVQEAEGALKSAEAERTLAQIERDRQAELVARETAAQAQLDQAEAGLGNTEGAVIVQTAALDRAKLDLSYTQVEAPFAGRVGVALSDVGALVAPDTGPLTVLTKLDPIEVEFSVSTSDLRAHQERVAAGNATNEASVALVLANGSAYDRPGDLIFVDSAVDTGTDSVTLRARFENPDLLLLDQELVRVRLTAGQSQNVLAIPSIAVQRDLQGDYVMIVNAESVVEAARVDVERTDAGLAIVRAGLNEGDMVIVDGVNKVRPGITVDAAPAENG